ncbi:MAG: M42 family metallopeptidase [Candidatus Stahlbacteria bacterium]|nr:M42 family metallopeptidase [Candidatus Stahlbacteria bacterium]
MKSESLGFLRTFMDAMSPSGFEDEAREIWKQRTKRFVDEVFSDVHGNAIAVLNKKGKPKVMLAGHMDEIGYMVKYVDSKGFIYFSPIGGIDLHLIPGKRVWIKTKKGKILGVIGREPIHTLEEEERKKVAKIENLFIDIGMTKKEETLELVSIGDPAIPAVGFEVLNKDRVVGRGFDDKGGAFIVSEILRLLSSEKKLKPSVYGVATVQEEIGLRGATTSAFRIAPDVGIAIDVTHATDYPAIMMASKQIKHGEVVIGKGPVISRGPNINPKVFDLLVEVAKKDKIPYQIEAAPRGTGTDANTIQLTREGVATGLVSIPNRYMHTPVELVSLDDLENIAKLLAGFIMRINEKSDFTL